MHIVYTNVIISFMSKLLDYFNRLDADSRKSFLDKAEMSESYLRRACSTGVKFSAERCVAIERASNHEITRKDLRDNWMDTWPELAEA